MKWLYRAPLSLITMIEIVLALAPFGAELHLWQKLKLLFAGLLVRPIDIAHLLPHGAPIAVLAVKLICVARARPGRGGAQEHDPGKIEMAG